MERRDSGFKKIINAYEIQQNYKESLKPIFNSFNNDFILTLFNLNYSANVPFLVIIYIFGRRDYNLCVKNTTDRSLLSCVKIGFQNSRM